MDLFLDTETYSTVPIDCGAHAYAEQSKVLLVIVACDDEPAQVLDCTQDPTVLDALKALVRKARRVIIHNSAFDRIVLAKHGVDIPLTKTHDTMVQALAHALPAKLSLLCTVLEVPQDKAKSKRGAALINRFTKPNTRGEVSDSSTHPDEWLEFIEYGRLDVEAMREVFKRMPTWNNTPAERELWLVDQAINDRGCAVDLDLAKNAQRAAKAEVGRLNARLSEITGGRLKSATQRAKVLDFLADEGLILEDLKSNTVAQALKRTDLTPLMREVLQIRKLASATSPAKYAAVEKAAVGGRLRGALQFCAAGRTGRWGGRIFQPQNLPRPTIKNEYIEQGIDAMRAGVEDLFFPNVMELCTSAIRGVIVAPPGRKLVVADLSNIEGRVLAWLAGEKWKLDAFSAFDRGEGPDLYKASYAKAYNKPVEKVEPAERQIGKVMELALGYQGAAGAFVSMAALYGLQIPETQAVALVRAWRSAHVATVALWSSAEHAIRSALANPGKAFVAGKLTYQVTGSWLLCKLPSGNRVLCYPNPRIGSMQKERAFAERAIAYDGFDALRRWTEVVTYGGKAVENATQAVARDILAAGIMRAEEAGYKPVLHVHDEIICETPDDPSFSSEGLAAIMSGGTQWSVGLPLAAAGFETYRYRKGD